MYVYIEWLMRINNLCTIINESPWDTRQTRNWLQIFFYKKRKCRINKSLKILCFLFLYFLNFIFWTEILWEIILDVRVIFMEDLLDFCMSYSIEFPDWYKTHLSHHKVYKLLNALPWKYLYIIRTFIIRNGKRILILLKYILWIAFYALKCATPEISRNI